MLIDVVPLWAIFFVSIALVIIAVEVGYRLGRTVYRKDANERESPVSAIAATILSLQAFMLAFTFGIVSDRYDSKKELVRQNANAIRTAWQRSDFLPEPDRTETKLLLRHHVDRAIEVSLSNDPDLVKANRGEGLRNQHRLWDIAARHGATDLNSDIGALVVESANEIASVESLRYDLGIDARIPTAIWIALIALLILGMMAVGYHTAIAESRRSRITSVLALSFSLVIALIAALDHPMNSLITVSQKPMINLQDEMNTVPGSQDVH